MAFREFLEIDKIGKTGENPWNAIFMNIFAKDYCIGTWKTSAIWNEDLKKKNHSQYILLPKSIKDSSDVFTNLIHQFFSVWAVEKENKFMICSKQFFSLSFPVLKWIITNPDFKKIVHSELEIGETI